MSEIREELLDAYAREMSIAEFEFKIMGKMLDSVFVKKRLELLEASELYIYGGGYLGIQFYNIASKFVKIPALVDKKGKLSIDIPNIPIIDTKKFKEVYKEEKVVIASVNYYNEIRIEISDFVPQSHILFLGEVLGGILK